MENILSYLKWRGDVLFKERPFNEVDSLICALIGYIEWDEIVNDQAVLLNVACQRYFELHDQATMMTTYAYSPMLVDLIQILQDTPRFDEVKLKKYVSIFDTSADTQFAAVSIEIPQNILYIAFRGTDASILGWKEDFDMMYQDVIESQKMAAEYLKHALMDIVEEKKILGFKYSQKIAALYLGGHSKGGNLAMYAAMCCKEMHPYITRVDSFDGPGFRPLFYETIDYLPVIKRIYNYVPIASIIGRIMEHQEQYIIVNGYSDGMQQHDGFYWQITRDHFCKVEAWTKESDKVKVYLEEILISKTDEEKKAFISLIYKVLEDLKINSINDFTELGIKESIFGIKELGTMNKEELKMFFEIAKLMLSQSKSFLYNKAIKTKKH